MVRIYTRDWQLVATGHTTEEAWLNLPAKYYGKKNELGLFAYYLLYLLHKKGYYGPL